jgi:hypothetical protein
MTTTIPEVREMVAAAHRFIAGDIHFSALVQPIEMCEWWSRVNGINSPVHTLAKRWLQLVDRTWNEFGQHSDPLTVEQLRREFQHDLESVSADEPY